MTVLISFLPPTPALRRLQEILQTSSQRTAKSCRANCQTPTPRPVLPVQRCKADQCLTRSEWPEEQPPWLARKGSNFGIQHNGAPWPVKTHHQCKHVKAPSVKSNAQRHLQVIFILGFVFKVKLLWSVAREETLWSNQGFLECRQEDSCTFPPTPNTDFSLV